MRKIYCSSIPKLNGENIICKSICSNRDKVEIEIYLEEGTKLNLQKPLKFQWLAEDIIAQNFTLEKISDDKDYNLFLLTLTDVQVTPANDKFDSILTAWNSKRIIKRKLNPSLED